ncbi:alpha/beta fold hydrolase [Actinomadura namibiensis]|uniref:alpha/beta fold hydrolase n=1 Tax=Actinomadura kijaniata TaxID=46161 RepID=UPI00360E84A6
MAYVCVRGVRHHVVDLGRELPGAPADPVVMLHGLLTGSAASWFFTVAPALARTRRVRLPDWRGHGRSERTPTGYGTAALAADLADLTTDLPPFALVGHSYGAAVAVRFALTRPGRVTRLALVDPPFQPVGAADLGRVFTAATPLGERAAALVGETSLLADLAAEPASPPPTWPPWTACRRWRWPGPTRRSARPWTWSAGPCRAPAATC